MMWWPFGSNEDQRKNNTNQSQCPLSEHSTESQQQTKDGSITRLPTDRTISSIPRYKPTTNESTKDGKNSKSSCPIDHHNHKSEENWIYPSPSQFYEALIRKKKEPRVNDMYTVVPIHNAVNERVWNQVLEWESNYGRGSFDRWPRSGKSGPMLSSFRGRPNDTSPRAWIKILSGYQAPFDRHDWEIIRPTEFRMRYIIDFYTGKGGGSSDNDNDLLSKIKNNNFNLSSDSLKQQQELNKIMNPNLSFYIDVRPALDNWEGIRMRLSRTWDEIKFSFSSSSSSNDSHKQS